MIKKENDFLVKAYNRIRIRPARDSWEVFSLFFCFTFAFINLIVFHIVFYNQYESYFSLADYSYNQDALNKYVGSLFFFLGWILLPMLHSIYRRILPIPVISRMAFASLGLYSTLLDNTIVFGFFVFVLVIQKTDLIDKIRQSEMMIGFKLIKESYFPQIHYSEET